MSKTSTNLDNQEPTKTIINNTSNDSTREPDDGELSDNDDYDGHEESYSEEGSDQKNVEHSPKANVSRCGQSPQLEDQSGDQKTSELCSLKKVPSFSSQQPYLNTDHVVMLSGLPKRIRSIDIMLFLITKANVKNLKIGQKNPGNNVFMRILSKDRRYPNNSYAYVAFENAENTKTVLSNVKNIQWKRSKQDVHESILEKYKYTYDDKYVYTINAYETLSSYEITNTANNNNNKKKHEIYKVKENNQSNDTGDEHTKNKNDKSTSKNSSDITTVTNTTIANDEQQSSKSWADEDEEYDDNDSKKQQDKTKINNTLRFRFEIVVVEFKKNTTSKRQQGSHFANNHSRREGVSPFVGGGGVDYTGSHYPTNGSNTNQHIYPYYATITNLMGGMIYDNIGDSQRLLYPQQIQHTNNGRDLYYPPNNFGGPSHINLQTNQYGMHHTPNNNNNNNMMGKYTYTTKHVINLSSHKEFKTKFSMDWSLFCQKLMDVDIFGGETPFSELKKYYHVCATRIICDIDGVDIYFLPKLKIEQLVLKSDMDSLNLKI